jgi:uncharacterized protein with HEPN domain
MHPKSPKLLEDTLRSCQRIETYTKGFSWDDYADNRLVRDAVERNLTIIGEALSRLERVDATTTQHISGFRQIVGLRHWLAHGYDNDINSLTIWSTIVDSIPVLRQEVEALLSEYDNLDDVQWDDQRA